MKMTTVSIIVKYSIPVFILSFPAFLGILELKYGVRGREREQLHE
jgi:hypothetical protein